MVCDVSTRHVRGTDDVRLFHKVDSFSEIGFLGGGATVAVNSLDRYKRYSRRRKRHAIRAGQRLDIQGLRMVAVVTVFANHLWGWPHGGFIGVDVFFVISGFLITGNLLRDAEARGTVSFRRFYWNRVRRIVPAASVVLLLTVAAATVVFLPFRAEQVAVDAGFAFAFLSNWWFAVRGTDYFTATESVSPLQHYWSLSIEEQFYFIWPPLIFLISLYVVRKSWTHDHRMRIAAFVMSGIIALSLSWALYETATTPVWAYFNTLSRVWELGTGALLACCVSSLARIPQMARPILSWGGLALIATSVVLISGGSVGFPAPWAMLPVVGASLVIAAGVGVEPKYQAFLRNPLSGYIGDISYSLYLVHWPVIVILGTLMDATGHYYLVVLALGFGLAIASYHLVEQPLRKSDASKLREVIRDIRKRRYHAHPATGYGALAALTFIAVASFAYISRPEAYEVAIPPPLAAAAPDELDPSSPQSQLGPVTAALREEINAALRAQEWPALEPSMESVIMGSPAPEQIQWCGLPQIPRQTTCSWGSPDASTTAVLVGDSIAMGYAGPLREIAETSNGQLFIRSEAMYGCQFIDDNVTTTDEDVDAVCPSRKQHAVNVINTTRPDFVLIGDVYGDEKTDEHGRELSYADWAESMRRMIARFQESGARVVFLSPPPPDVTISECYGKRSSTPASCVGGVTDEWRAMAKIEQKIASDTGGVWIDSRPWFCNGNRQCPAFVGTTPTKMDWAHPAPAYGMKIARAIDESLRAAGLY